MTHSDNKNGYPVIEYFANYAIIADSVSPEP